MLGNNYKRSNEGWNYSAQYNLVNLLKINFNISEKRAEK